MTTRQAVLDAALRAGLASAMLVGVVLGRRVIGVPALLAADREDLVATVGPAIHRLLVGTEPAHRGPASEG